MKQFPTSSPHQKRHVPYPNSPQPHKRVHHPNSPHPNRHAPYPNSPHPDKRVHHSNRPQ